MLAHGQVIVSANGSVEGLDLETGQQVWVLEGVEKNTGASPLVAHGVLVAPGGEVATTVAVRLGGQGELGSDAVIWRAKEASAGFVAGLRRRAA